MNQGSDTTGQNVSARQTQLANPNVPTTVNNGGFWNFLKKNKLLVAILALILIGLIWWFCMRKKGTKVTVGTPVAPITGANQITVTRTRNANAAV